jgi:hypothetical protein
MASLRATSAGSLALTHSHLNGAIAINFLSLELSNSVWADLNHCYRDRLASFSEYSGHAALSTDQTNRHFLNLIVYGA